MVATTEEKLCVKIERKRETQAQEHSWLEKSKISQNRADNTLKKGQRFQTQIIYVDNGACQNS